jgi:hypothetical protein
MCNTPGPLQKDRGEAKGYLISRKDAKKDCPPFRSVGEMSAAEWSSKKLRSMLWTIGACHDLLLPKVKVKARARFS